MTKCLSCLRPAEALRSHHACLSSGWFNKNPVLWENPRAEDYTGEKGICLLKADL